MRIGLIGAQCVDRVATVDTARAIKVAQGQHVERAPIGTEQAVSRRRFAHHREGAAVIRRAHLRGPGIPRVQVTWVAQSQGMAKLMQQCLVALAARRKCQHRLHIHPHIARQITRATLVGHPTYTLGGGLLANAKTQLADRGAHFGHFGEGEFGQ